MRQDQGEVHAEKFLEGGLTVFSGKKCRTYVLRADGSKNFIFGSASGHLHAIRAFGLV